MTNLSTPTLYLLFIAFRLLTLALYRPGGLLGAGDPYPMLPTLVAAHPLWHQLLWGILLLPFELGTLWFIEQLGIDGTPERDKKARWRAFLWAVSPLPLWTWLIGITPLLTFLLLAFFWVARGGEYGSNPPRWLWSALALGGISLLAGATSELAALLLPFILLLSNTPVLMGSGFGLAALLADPVAGQLGVTGGAAIGFQVGYILVLVPILVEWLWRVRALNAWRVWEMWRVWRQPVWMGASGMSMFCFVLALFILTPAELYPKRLEASPLAPALHEMQAAPEGWFLTDSHALWEEAVSLGVGSLTPRVVSERNLDTLQTELTSPDAIWLLHSSNDAATALLDPLVANFFPADEQTLADGSRLRRFVSAQNGPFVPIEGLFIDGVELTGIRQPERVRAGSMLPLELQWGATIGEQKLFLHLIAPDGSLATQRDTFPRPTPDRHALLLPATLPAGTYTLIVGRYDPNSGERVALVQGGNSVVLGEVIVK